MKMHLVLVAAVTLCFMPATVHAQPTQDGRARPGPDFSGYMSKLFADNPAFTANLEFHSYGAATGTAVTAQGKLAYLNGKTRFEMDMSNAGDANLPRQDASTLKHLGMDTMIAILNPELRANYFVYPGMKAYVRRPTPGSETGPPQYMLAVTNVGDENVLGQNCVKNTVVVTGPDGVPRESTVWNATDLNKFPIKIETAQNGATVVMLFRDLNLSAPDAAQFNPPADYKQYDSFMSLMKGSAATQAAR